MTAKELYQKEFGNADSVSKEEVIRLLKHFGVVLYDKNKEIKQLKALLEKAKCPRQHKYNHDISPCSWCKQKEQQLKSK